MEKKIIFSWHAENRRKQRGFNKEHIIEVILRPDYIKKNLDNSRTAVKTVYGRTITVVYLEQESYIKIITVF